jgi:hypothetical protein
MLYRAFATLLAFSLPCLLAAQAPSSEDVKELKTYESCSFPDGLQVSDISSMPSAVKDRPIQSHGKTGTVPLLAGRRVIFSYPGADPYASVKIELLPAAGYSANRKLVLDDFDDIVASDKHVAKNLARKSPMSGFGIVGLDRDEIKGTTLGIYMLMDDYTHVVTTIYLLNPPQSKIKTLADYARMRDTFLYNYTRCIRNNEIGKSFGVPK